MRSLHARTRVSIILTLILLLVLVSHSVRFVSAQPSAVTGPATDITDTSATLTGVVITGLGGGPAGSVPPTLYTFAVDANGAFVLNCPESPGGVPPTVPQAPVACKATGLTPSTTYSYTLDVCWTAWGPGNTCAYGSTLTFTTEPQYQYQTLTTNVSPPGSGSVEVGPKTCSSTCSFQIIVGAVGDIVAVPATGWAFSSWTITGATCPTGPTTNPCKGLTMPNNPVSITAIFTALGPPFDFALSVSPSVASVNQGDTAHFAVGVTYSDPSYAGTMINIQLAGLGPEMNYDLSQSGDLTVTTSQTTPTGSYSIVLTGSANGVTHTTGMTLIVTSGTTTTSATTTTSVLLTTSSSVPFDYSVTVSPSTQSVEIGGSTSYVVSVLPLGGSPVPVSLTLIGAPGDVRSSFTTQSANPPYTSTLNLDLSASSANAGSYTLTVVASAAGNTKSATATLIIKEKTETQTTTAPTTTNGSSWLDTVQQNSTIIIAALVALVVVLGVVVMRGRGRHAATQPAGATGTFCGKCGAENPASSQFCTNCGNKLKES